MRSTWVIAALILAQSQPAAPPPAPQQTFRSGRQLVEVDVRVLQDGNFVTDLTAADFQLTEDGVPQKIESVVFITSDSQVPASRPERGEDDLPAIGRPDRTPIVGRIGREARRNLACEVEEPDVYISWLRINLFYRGTFLIWGE